MKHSALKLHRLFLLLPLVTACAVPSADIIPRYGQFDLDGHFGVENPTDFALDNEVDVTDLGKAGLNRDDGYIGARVDLDFGSPVLMLSSQQSTHQGTGTTLVDLSAGTGSVDAGDTVNSKMDFGLHQLVLTFDLVPTDMVEAGIGLGIALVDVDADMSEVGTNDSIHTDQLVPIPQLAVRGGVDLGEFEAVAVISGLELSAGGDKISFFDIDLLARYRLFGGDERLRGSIAIGYRSTKLDLEYEQDNDHIVGNFHFEGPYLAFVFSI